MEKLHKVISVKFSETLEEQAHDNAAIRGFTNQGQYLRWLVARDTEMLEEAISNRRHPVTSLDARHG